MEELIRVKDFGYRYPKSHQRITLDADFILKKGETVLISGPTGCGKSTLLSAMAGTLPGEMDGCIAISPELVQTGEEISRVRIALVLQNPETQLLCSTVGEEAAFGPRNLGVEDRETEERCRRYLRFMGLEGLENHHVEDLSMGQKQRLALVSVLTMEPLVLLLDEPFSQLDPSGRDLLIALIHELKTNGRGLVICEHENNLPPGVIDRHIVLSNEFGEVPPVQETLPGMTPAEPLDTRIHMEHLSLAHAGGQLILDDLSLTVDAGEKVLVSGPNGSGKSSLLKCILGVLKPTRGAVAIGRFTNPRPGQLFGTIGYLMQNPERQLFSASVSEEVDFCLKRLGMDPATIHERTRSMLSLMQISHLADRSPFTLSFGQKHLVALASVLAPLPPFILLDEPFTGLDHTIRALILEALDQVHAASGCAIVMTTHNDNLHDWAHSHYKTEKGRLTDAVPAE